jgi:hypothetical protein
LTGLRFLYWDFALKHRERERLKRLEALAGWNGATDSGFPYFKTATKPSLDPNE